MPKRFFIARSVAWRDYAIVSCPSESVCPSVTLVDCDHTRWNSSKIISRILAQPFFYLQTPIFTDLLQKVHPKFSQNRNRVGKIVDFRHLSRSISETVQDRVQVSIDH